MSESTKPVFTSGRERRRVVTLVEPLAFEGVTYDAIVIKRLTAQDVSAFNAVLADTIKANPDAALRWPMYETKDGAPVPDAVLDGLDDDDAFEIQKVVADFLPRRYRDAPASTSAPSAGENTAL